MAGRYVPFIRNDKLVPAVKGLIDTFQAAIANGSAKIDKNKLDPFMALFDSIISGTTYNVWLKKELRRQSQLK